MTDDQRKAIIAKAGVAMADYGYASLWMAEAALEAVDYFKLVEAAQSVARHSASMAQWAEVPPWEIDELRDALKEMR